MMPGIPKPQGCKTPLLYVAAHRLKVIKGNRSISCDFKDLPRVEITTGVKTRFKGGVVPLLLSK